MAWTGAQNLYALYVISKVETNHDFAGVNLNDAITLGIVQWYGTRAAGLLTRLKNDAPSSYAKLSDRIRNMHSSTPDSSSAWTGFYLTNADAESWKQSAKDDANHAVQEAQWVEDLEGYKSTLAGWGVDVNNVKSCIFYISIYHQSPQACLQIIRGIGGNRDIGTIRNAALSNGIVGSYRNRQNTVHSLLNAWDGTGSPPDFGQSSDGVPGDAGGDLSASGMNDVIKYIEMVGDQLVVHGDVGGGRLLCYKSQGGIWLPKEHVEDNPGAGGGGGTTPGGGDPSESNEFRKMRALWESNASRWNYSQAAGRLNPPATGYSDCSACVYWAANEATGGKYSWMGTWTGAMVSNCTFVADFTRTRELPIEIMRPGDLVLMDYGGDGGSDHVDWYWGNNVLWGAGSAPLPKQISTDARNYYKYRSSWGYLRVYRFLDGS